MRTLTVCLAALVGVGTAVAEETISVNKGQWTTSMSIFTVMSTAGDLNVDPPEIEVTNECWATDAETELNLDFLALDECTQSNAQVTSSRLFVELYCTYSGVGMTGVVDLNVDPDRDSLQGYFQLRDDMGMDELKVHVAASFTAQKTGECTG